MKSYIRYKGQKAELKDDSIWIDGKDTEEDYWEYDSKEYAEKVWQEILKEWRKKNYYWTSDLGHFIMCTCEFGENERHLTHWP